MLKSNEKALNGPFSGLSRPDLPFFGVNLGPETLLKQGIWDIQFSPLIVGPTIRPFIWDVSVRLGASLHSRASEKISIYIYARVDLL